MTKDSFVSPKHSRPWSQSGSTPDVGLATSSLQALHSSVPGLSVRSGKVMTGLALKEEESPPIRLAKLNRSPQSILTNRMRFVTMQADRSKGRPRKDDEEVETGNIEQEIAARLDHIEKEKSVKKEKLLAMKDRLLEDYRVAVEAVREARERIKLQQTQLVFHHKSLQCLLALKAEEERIHEEALQKIQDLKPRLVYRPPELARSQGSVFSCLTSLSGQLTELCWGRAGAGLVVDRLELGTDQERKVLWSELRLPGSLLSILLTDNKNFISVLLAIVKFDWERRYQLLGQVRKYRKSIENINKDFLKDIEKIVY